MFHDAAERNTLNMPNQGSATDFINIGMINVYWKFQIRNFKTIILLHLHDELLFISPNGIL